MYLGIDVGTSKVAAGILDASEGEVLHTTSRPHNADLKGPEVRSEQDPDKLLQAVAACTRDLPADLRKCVKGIGLTGQMHSCLPLGSDRTPAGPAITWQDARCDCSLLEEIHRRTGRRLSSGFAMATLFVQLQRGQWPEEACPAGVPDLVRLAYTDAANTIHPTLAQSWGLFDLETGNWDAEGVTSLGIDPGLLPRVSESQGIGRLSASGARELDLPEGTSIAPAIGDNQASILAGLDDPADQAFVTLGTGGQLSVVLTEAIAAPSAAGQGLEIRPFFSGMRIAVCASLAGGSAWQWLARTAGRWIQQLGLEPPGNDAIYRKLNELGLAATQTIDVRPTFHAQRWAPQELGRIENLGPSPLDLGHLARGLAEGIFRQLRSRMPQTLLEGRTRLWATGNALRRNPLLRRAAQDVLGGSLELAPFSEQAAVGAARFAANHLG